MQNAYRIVESGYFTGGRYSDALFTAIALSFHNVAPLNFIWSAPFILAATYAFGILVLSYNISKRFDIAILSVFFGVFILSSGPIRPGFFITLNSNTILQSIFPLVLCTIYERMMTDGNHLKDFKNTVVLLGLSLTAIFSVIKIFCRLNWTAEGTLFVESTLFPILMIIVPLVGLSLSVLLKEKKARGLFLTVFFCSVICFFMHMDETILYTFAMILFVVVCQLVTKRFSRLLTLILGLFTIVFVGLQWVDMLNIYSTNFLSALWIPELALSQPVNIFGIYKKANFEVGYGIVVYCLIILGYVFAIASRRESDRIMAIMFSILTIVFFLPEYQTIRVDSQLFPFMAYILVMAFSTIQQKIMPFNNLKKSSSNKMASASTLIIMLVAIAPSLINPICEISFKLSSPQDPYSYSSIAEYEYEAASWIRKNLPETTIIISDYRTMLILNSIGNKIWLTSKGMSVTELDPKSQQVLRIIKFQIFGANNSRVAYDNIMLLPSLIDIKEKRYIEYTGISPKNLTFIVVVSSRTIKWLEQESIGDIAHAQHSEILAQDLSLFSNEYFELIYQGNFNLYIYKVKVIRY